MWGRGGVVVRYLLAAVGVLMIKLSVVVIALGLVRVTWRWDGMVVWVPAGLIVRGVDPIAGATTTILVGLSLAAATVTLTALPRGSPVTVEVAATSALPAAGLSLRTYKVVLVVPTHVGSVGGAIVGTAWASVAATVPLPSTPVVVVVVRVLEPVATAVPLWVLAWERRRG